MKSESDYHTPALLQEAIDLLAIKAGEVYVDATVGGGGHSIEIIRRGGRVFGLDIDPDAVDRAGKRLAQFCNPPDGGNACSLNAFRVVPGNFAKLSEILIANRVSSPAGILFDLGTSFHQLAQKGRGFSFQFDEPLDMRMDPELQVTASDLINALAEKELNDLFTKLGEEKYSRAISRDIVRTRKLSPIKTTGQLSRLIVEVYQKYHVDKKIHPATKTFQALRIAVNDELNNLRAGLPQALDCLKPKGRIVVLSFQGLEDRIVKNFFAEEEKNNRLHILTEKPIQPSLKELADNPRSRSAKLRAAQKI